jgi:ParB family chromosome partitioning protein
MENLITEVKLLNVEDIVANDYNPNEMDNAMFEQIMKSLERDGFLVPIIVREEKGKYIIIDGEHRWRAAKEKNQEKIPAIILDKNRIDSMLMTVGMNKLRGELDPIKLSEVVSKLLKTFTFEELQDMLGYSRQELEYLDSLLEYNLDTFKNDGNLTLQKHDQLDELIEGEFEVELPVEEYEKLIAILETIGGKDQAESFVKLCQTYLKQN